MSNYHLYTGVYDVQLVENGLISHWTTPDGGDMRCVYQDCDNVDAVAKLGEVVGGDVSTLLNDCTIDKGITHYKITLTVENLCEEGGAA